MVNYISAQVILVSLMLFLCFWHYEYKIKAFTKYTIFILDRKTKLCLFFLAHCTQRFFGCWLTFESSIVNILPLRSKLLKSLQNEAIFPLITMNVLIYASDLSNQSY